jgi:hypothetical protein
MVWATNKPPRGGPASGPGLWGEANDPGKGQSAAKVAPRITAENARARALKAHTPEAEAKRRTTIATIEELKERLTAVIRDDATPKHVLVQAIDKLADRLEGKPTQKTELSGPDGAPVAVTEIRRVIIDRSGNSDT